MKKLYLHIGTHKTGSTAIQYVLNRNKEFLAEQGWLYPIAGRTGKQIAHQNLAWALRRGTEFDFSALKHEIEASKCMNVIISSEEFEYCEDVEKVKEAFSFCEVEIVLFLRRQDDLLLSAYNQNIKAAGYFKPLAKFNELLKRQGRFDYVRLCERWVAVFGQRSVHAGIYNAGQDVTQDFAKVVRLPAEGVDGLQERQVNASVDPRLTGVLKLLNQMKAEDVDGALMSELFEIVRKFGKKLGNERRYALMNVADRVKFMQKFSQDNALLSKKYLSGKSFPDPQAKHTQEVKIGENALPPGLMKELMFHLAKRRA